MSIADHHASEAKRPTLFSTTRQAFDADEQILARLDRRIATTPRRAEGRRPSRLLLAAAAVLIVGMIATLAVLAREAGSGRKPPEPVLPPMTQTMQTAAQVTRPLVPDSPHRRGAR